MIRRLAVSLSLVLLLSGCSNGQWFKYGVDPTPTITAPADPMASFKQIASASCAEAFGAGVVETRDDSGLLIMIPKDEAIDGYSAVFKDLDTGHLDLIYEADSFYACAAELMWQAAIDSGEGEIAGVDVKWDAGKYILTEEFEDSTFTYTYEVENGLIVGGTVVSTDDQVPTQFTEVYGDVSEENRAVIQQAIDELTASE